MGISGALVHFRDKTFGTVYNNGCDRFYRAFKHFGDVTKTIESVTRISPIDAKEFSEGSTDCSDGCINEPVVLEVVNYGFESFGIKSKACRYCRQISGPVAWDIHIFDEIGGMSDHLDGNAQVQEAIAELRDGNR